jgi:CDP-diacylglycerol--serine O-phosphatidyltransferase
MMYFNCSLRAAGGIAVFFAWIPLLIAVFSAVRLAKFNLDERQHSSFIGLPTPASALICGSLCCLLDYLPDSFGTAIPWILIGVSLVLCVLLVCELPMFSFKFGKDIEADTATKMLRYALLSISFIIIVLVILFALPWPAIILGIFLVYILENALFRLLAPNKA